MSTIYKYKWFVWSAKLQRYLAIPHMFPDNRGEYPGTMIDFFGDEQPPMFSIPLYL